jgi:hypothetical protein
MALKMIKAQDVQPGDSVTLVESMPTRRVSAVSSYRGYVGLQWANSVFKSETRVPVDFWVWKE